MLCHFCEQEKSGLPFRCNYCGNYFCSEHRLPENHICPRVGGPKQPGYSDVASLQERYAKSHGHVGLPKISNGRRGIRPRYPGIFSRAERKHIFIAAAMVTGVGISFFYTISGTLNLLFLFIGAIGFLVSFFGHELSHKFFAQRNGMWAEFRTTTYGLMLTAFSLIPIPIFRFIAPGVTNVVGEANRELQGAIALIGPGFNVVFGTLCVLSGALLGKSLIGFALVLIGVFNGYMALFNLLPFVGMDGLKAWEWDKMRWAITLIGSIALIAVQFLLSYIP